MNFVNKKLNTFNKNVRKPTGGLLTKVSLFFPDFILNMGESKINVTLLNSFPLSNAKNLFGTLAGFKLP